MILISIVIGPMERDVVPLPFPFATETVSKPKMSIRPTLFHLFVCLGFSSHLGIFHSCGDVIITSEGLQILTCARHLWPLSSEGCLACHTYCGTGIRLKWSSPRTRDTHTNYLAFGSAAVTTCFLRLRSVAAGIRTPNFPLAGRTL